MNLVGVVLFLVFGVGSALGADLVTYDGTNVVWNLSPLVDNVIGAILSVLFGVTTMFVIVTGVRWIYKFVRSIGGNSMAGGNSQNWANRGFRD